MSGLANLAWAVMCTAGATWLLVTLITDRAELRHRFTQFAHLLSEAGPWLVAAVLHPWSLRGRRLPLMNPHHPSVKAARRCDCTACTDELSPVAFADWEREFHGRRTS